MYSVNESIAYARRARQPVLAAGDVENQLSLLCTRVARSHPIGHAAIYARFNTERRAAGQDGAQLEAMYERWLALEREADEETQRQFKARYEANIRTQIEEGRRVSVNHWRERLVINAILREFRTELEESSKLRDVNDDADLLKFLDGLTALLRRTEQTIGAERREAKTRLSAARAAAIAQTYAPKGDDASLAA